MRALWTAVLVGLALAGAALSFHSAPGSSAERPTAEFVRATCMPALEDPARLERMADERGWPRFIDRSSRQPNFMTVIGTGRANQGGQSLLVSVATSEKHGRPQNICSVVFEDAKPIRAGFVTAMLAGWECSIALSSRGSL
jgi:hypothetical protein